MVMGRAMTVEDLTKQQRELEAENKQLREACREALLFFTAPADSPRLWPVSRGNLARMLEDALIRKRKP